MRLNYHKKLLSLAALCLISGSGCNEEVGVKIPLDTVYYPTYLTINPLHPEIAYLVNGNVDLQFTSGSIEVVDLSDLSYNGDGLAAINQEGSLRIASFGGQIAFSADGTRAMIPIRGSSAVLPMTISDDGKRVRCKVEGQDCYEKAQVLLPEDFSLDYDPSKIDDFYSLSFVPRTTEGKDRLMIGTLGYSCLLPVEWAEGTMEVTADKGYYGGEGGIADLAWLDGQSLLIGASQYVDNRDSRLFITSTVQSPYSITYVDVYGQFAGSSINAVAPVDDHRILMSNTFPHSLVMVDLNLKDRDRSNGAVLWGTALEGESADLLIYDHPMLGQVVFVSVMDTDVIEVFSLSTGILLGRIYTEGGPFSMAIGQGKDGSKWLLVSEYYSHGLAIYDISAGAVSQFSLKQRINDGKYTMAKRD